jgi:hypothetical protein
LIQPINRRSFMAGAAGLAGLARFGSYSLEQGFPPFRVVTHGPKFHWFGYFDKLQFDPSGRFALGMEVDFEHRSPTPDDTIRIGMVDLQDKDRWIELGSSRSWCWQQGCMLQWIPGSRSRVLWNDREGDRFVCRILDVETKEMRTISHPVYALSPDGKTAISTDFSRLAEMRPGYGYAGLPDLYSASPAPKETGIFRVDLESGAQQMILSLHQVVNFGPSLPSMAGSKHWFNHLLFNPDGSRFVFLHRWRVGKGRLSRLLSAAPDGTDLRVLDANGLTSHFNWRDPSHVLVFSKQPCCGARFYIFEDGDRGDIQVVAKDAMTQDGHCSFLPGLKWILNDTYPDTSRMQHVYLCEAESGRIVLLGNFYSPPAYNGEWRCDTHPRHSQDGKTVMIDSPAAGSGRQLHLIDISGLSQA